SGDFHGAIYEFNRNSKFGANSFFNNVNGVARPFLNRNQFGGTISGPTVLPRFGEGGKSVYRHKGFFFFNTEIFRQRSQSAGVATTLLAPARNGTFTYTATNGTQQTVNVLSGAGLLPGNAFTLAGGAI